MADWTKSMQRTYEYYIVDPGTWKDAKLIPTARNCVINRDKEAETLGSVTIDVDEELDECYVRAYLITNQNGLKEKWPLATFLVQTPANKFNGRMTTTSIDAYTPLLELKENPIPLGYFVAKNENIMDSAYHMIRENLRAPVVSTVCDEKVYDDFVAETSDTWLSYNSALIANAKYELDLDEMGRVLFAPIQDTASLQPVWTYTDDNCSIIYPEINLEHDYYGVPNVVEVIYSNGANYYHTRVVNDDENSPTSTVNRGREIVYRDTNPSISGVPTKAQIEEYAELLLRQLSTFEYTISYTHGYCPVRLGDCVRFDHEGMGLKNVKAKVIYQSIKCDPSCPVTEKAVYTVKLWR